MKCILTSKNLIFQRKRTTWIEKMTAVNEYAAFCGLK